MPEYAYELELEVRDYECDLEGVGNNAVYLNYLEHARHSYLRTRGLDFAHLHQQGCDLVMTRAEIDYRVPLRIGDRFVVRLNLGRESRLRFLFEQTIHRLPGMERVLDARIIGTGIIAGKPGLPDEVQAVIAPASSGGSQTQRLGHRPSRPSNSAKYPIHWSSDRPTTRRLVHVCAWAGSVVNRIPLEIRPPSVMRQG